MKTPCSTDRFVDLNHVVTAGMVTYPGLPAPVITPHMTREQSPQLYAAGTQFTIDTLTLVGNTGTYLDSPFHRFAGGADLAGLALDTLVDLPALVVDARHRDARGIGPRDLPDRTVEGCAVLFHTGWAQYFGTDRYGVDAPFLTEAGAERLVADGAVLVGIDSVNIDDAVAHGPRPAHTILLGAGVHVVEHLTGLEQMPGTGATFTAIPPRISGFGSFPVRAFGRIPPG
jgi:kynurenine formamidase